MSSDDRRSHGRGVASGNSSEAHRGGMSHSAASRTAAATFATPDPDARHGETSPTLFLIAAFVCLCGLPILETPLSRHDVPMS